MSLEQTLGTTLGAFRTRRIEPEWERLDRPEGVRFAILWDGLRELGVTGLGLPESRSGIDLDPESRFAIVSRLGAAVPSLAFALIAHATALALLDEATDGGWPGPLGDLPTGAPIALAASPLDADADDAFQLTADGRLSGTRRVALAHSDSILLSARDGEFSRLCVLRLDTPGVRFAPCPSSHGLRLIRFGELTVSGVTLPAPFVLPWPGSGFAAHEADGLLTALLAGMAEELTQRAVAYAVGRRQGGKMINEHDAVQQLVGPIAFAERSLRALSLDALSRQARGDGGAAAFAVQTVRTAALDAIQTLGGYGYMEDYRVERYLRDANTLETFWIHAASRQRAIARARFAELLHVVEAS
jgi:alkylation response protein AidB-like acyl-CoA dehydrogenase